jgi:hypothetical protein
MGATLVGNWSCTDNKIHSRTGDSNNSRALLAEAPAISSPRVIRPDLSGLALSRHAPGAVHPANRSTPLSSPVRADATVFDVLSVKFGLWSPAEWPPLSRAVAHHHRAGVRATDHARNLD